MFTNKLSYTGNNVIEYLGPVEVGLSAEESGMQIRPSPNPDFLILLSLEEIPPPILEMMY
jgi:hypothetical protein